MEKFKRERRYVVLKISDMHDFLPQPMIDLLNSIADEVSAGRRMAGKLPLECVIVESDWPEYEPTWSAIQARTECGNCFEGKSDMEHICRKCNGTGLVA